MAEAVQPKARTRRAAVRQASGPVPASIIAQSYRRHRLWSRRRDRCGAAAYRDPLQGVRVVIQGFGSVGKHAARFLVEKGAVLVAASDTRGTIVNEDGLDLPALLALKAEGRALNDYPCGRKLGADAVIDVPCEIWIPAARPDVIHARLETRLVAEGANVPLTTDAARALAARGVLVLPDFLANAGGVICAAVEYRGGTERAAALALIDEKIRANTEAVLDEVKRTGALPRTAAMLLATERVERAMRIRRWDSGLSRIALDQCAAAGSRPGWRVG